MNAPTGPPSPSERPGYAMPGTSYPAPPIRHTSHARLFVFFGIGLFVVILVTVLVAWLLTPTIPVTDCKYSNCGGPPPTAPPVGTPPGGPIKPISGSAQNPAARPLAGAGQPVQTYPRFTAPDKSWSVAYPPDLNPDPDRTYVGWEYTDKDVKGSQVRLFGEKARDRTAQDVVNDVIDRNCPGATLVYQVPNAMVGYQPGYGEMRDFIPQSGTASFQKGRVMAIVAIKNGVALGVIALGPYHRFAPGDPSGHVSGANLLIAADIGMWVNTFMWKGDPPR